MKKVIFGLVLVASAFGLASCTDLPPPAEQPSYKTESQKLEENQKRMVDSVKVPTLTESVERANIARRADIFNKADKLSYVYLVSFGKVMAFHTVKGKISSVNSYLTPQEKLVSHDGGPCKLETYQGYTVDCMSIQAPDIDGSYGTNGDAIFFFTTEGAYVEWKGEYMVSDQPLKLTETPSLIRNVQ